MEQLRLRSMTLSDGGWYTCVVSNMYGQIQRSAWIEVVREESFVGTSSDKQHRLYVVIAVALGVIGTVVFVTAIVCFQRRRPPKSRQLVLRENSMYFQLIDLPVDPQWEISRLQ